MTDDDDDRPDHVGTPADETPFDHGCSCPTCEDYREEVRDALARGGVYGLSPGQVEDAKRIRKDELGDQ